MSLPDVDDNIQRIKFGVLSPNGRADVFAEGDIAGAPSFVAVQITPHRQPTQPRSADAGVDANNGTTTNSNNSNNNNTGGSNTHGRENASAGTERAQPQLVVVLGESFDDRGKVVMAMRG